MTDGLIGITGATGGVGGRPARRLADRGAAQRLIVRDASRAPELPGAEVAVTGGYADAEGMTRALTGVHTLFFVPATEAADRVAQHRTVVDAAVAAGVQRVVDLSFINPTKDATFTFVRHHWATEAMWRDTGISPSCATAPTSTSSRTWPARTASSPAPRARVLTDASHDGQAYDLTGREALSLADAAETMSRISGKRIVFEDQAVEEAYASRAHLDAPEWMVEAWVSNYVAIARGEMDVVSDAIRRLAGHEPATLAEYLEANPGALDHVKA